MRAICCQQRSSTLLAKNKYYVQTMTAVCCQQRSSTDIASRKPSGITLKQWQQYVVSSEIPANRQPSKQKTDSYQSLKKLTRLSKQVYGRMLSKSQHRALGSSHFWTELLCSHNKNWQIFHKKSQVLIIAVNELDTQFLKDFLNTGNIHMIKIYVFSLQLGTFRGLGLLELGCFVFVVFVVGTF